jgi:hypothetical protein
MLGVKDMLPTLSTKRGKGGVLKLRNGTRKRDKLLVIHLNLHPINQQVG